MKKFVCLIMLIGSVLPFVKAQNNSADRPNIILIMADDLGIGDVGYTGFNQFVETPAIDKMARSGIRFDRFYSQSPVCSPTRGSVLTGRHPFRYGIFEANVGCLRNEETAIPELLSQEGYRSGHFGKWHLGVINDSCHIKGMCNADPFDFGYDDYFATHHSVYTYNPNVHVVEGGTDSLNIDSTYIRNGVLVKELLYGDDSKIIMNEALDFIEKNKSESFFSTIWFHTPHKPVVGPPELKDYYNNKYPGQLSKGQLEYYAAITAMDMQIDRMRDSLEAWGIADNTMIWFCSDNGPTGSGQAGVYKGAKRHLYEGGVRVPGILVWPEKISGSRIEKAVVTTSDYFPTILDVINSEQEPLQPLDGISILPIIENQVETRSTPLCFQSHGSMVCMNEDFKLMQAGYKGSVNLGLETGVIHNQEEWMLFDMHNDSIESRNIIAQHPDIADSLKEVLLHWMDTVYLSFTGEDYSGNYITDQSYRFSGGIQGQDSEEVSENRLGGIYINGQILNGFDPDVYSYQFKLLEDEIPEIVATTDAANAAIDTIIKPTDLSGTSEVRSATIKVVAEDQTVAIYTIEFAIMSEENNAHLESITINQTAYTDFTPFKTDYYVVLPYGTTEVPTVNATAFSPQAGIDIKQAVQIANAKEAKRTATIKVISESNSDSLEYRLIFSVGLPSSNTFLSDLLINNQSIAGFTPYQCTYYLEVPDSTAKYTISGIPADENGRASKDTIQITKGEFESSTGTINVSAPNGIAEWEYEVILTPVQVSDTSETGDSTSTSVLRNVSKINLCVYPNPCSDFLKIDTDIINFSVKIYDSSGQMILETYNETIISLENLLPGVYFLSVIDQNRKEAQRVKFLKI